MKRLVAIHLLFFYLISFTEFSEVLRLPLLIEHYTEHKSKVGDLSFWEFLVMHYETDAAHDDTDNELPFKECGHSFTASVALPDQRLQLQDVNLNSEKRYSLFYFQHAPSLVKQDIFQPPKV